MTLSQASAAETIVAVGSPPGRSPRALVRLSGPDASGLLAALLVDASTALPPPRRLEAVRLRLPPTGVPLPALLLRFAGPASYTGQDMAELQVPGNPALLDRLTRALIDAGARPAEPGEFTFRALLAGKLGLTEAEGVAATIAATSDGELRAAAMLRRGELGRRAGKLVDALGRALALTEAGIDFVDQEDVVPITPGELAGAVAAARGGVDELLRGARPWGAVSDLPWVVLMGPPSAGKSTLFNALLGRDRAVVDPAPGTTRDVLAEPLRLRGDADPDTEVMLVDLAGLDEPAGWLDRRVQAAAREALGRADVILRVRDARAPTPSRLAPPPGTTVLDVWTKLDAHPGAPPLSPGVIGVSALRGLGLDALREAVRAALGGRASGVAAGALALQPRHEAALRSASRELARAARLLEPQRGAHALGDIELVAGSLRAALDELAALGGRLTPDDVIGRVFATFCVGK